MNAQFISRDTQGNQMIFRVISDSLPSKTITVLSISENGIFKGEIILTDEIQNFFATWKPIKN